jgi:6,7-dimethyl-8-ribityllumazine synthase
MSSKNHFAIVRSAYRPDIVGMLLKGVTAVLDDAGAVYEEIEVSGSLVIHAAIAMLQAGE